MCFFIDVGNSRDFKSTIIRFFFFSLPSSFPSLSLSLCFLPLFCSITPFFLSILFHFVEYAVVASIMSRLPPFGHPSPPPFSQILFLYSFLVFKYSFIY